MPHTPHNPVNGPCTYWIIDSQVLQQIDAQDHDHTSHRAENTRAVGLTQ